MLTDDQRYQAVLTRDARFDGRFFVAVRSTRIYCRPICRVRTPLRKNCRFFEHAAAAEAAGYRPCKRCRPELAPGNSSMDASSHLARSTEQLISQDFLADHSLPELAERLGVTDRQMRRAFHDAFGVSPVEFWQTQRLLLAKQLLTDSKMPVTMVAFASGFQSLRRFNALLKARYRMSPTDLRKTHSRANGHALSDFAFRLSYRPPLDWNRLLGFLAKRTIGGVEAVVDSAYLRTVRLNRNDRQYIGTIRVAPLRQQHMLAVQLSDSLLPVCAAVLDRVKRLFDLQADPVAIGAALRSLGGVCRGVRVPGCFDPFELAVRAILGQQISVAAATTLAGRFVQHFGQSLSEPQPPLTHLFPTPQRIARLTPEKLTQAGIIASRAKTIIALAESIVAGKLALDASRRVEDVLDELRAIPGVGEWTAQYIAMRALSWPDAFPHTDLGLCKAMRETRPKEILKRAERWRPWRAYAAMHFWTSHSKKPENRS